MICDMDIYKWLVRIDTMRLIKSLPTTTTIAREVRTHTGYHHKGLLRKRELHLVFQYTLSGVGEVLYDNKVYSVPEGHCFFFKTSDPKASYYFPSHAKEAWDFVYANFEGHSQNANIDEILENWGPVHSIPKNSMAIQNLLKYEKYNLKTITLPLNESNKIFQDIIEQIIKSYENKDDRQKHYLIDLAQNHVLENLKNGLNASELAKELKISREHLCRLFNEQLGISPYQYIKKKRMETAETLLKTTQMSCKEIANDLGFSHASLFNQSFKEYKGLTPRKYRIANGVTL